MNSLKYLLVLGTLLTASAFTADIFAPYIGRARVRIHATLGYNARILYTTFLYLHHLSSDNELKILRYEVFSGVTTN